MKTRRQRKVTFGALCLGLAFAVFSLNNTPVKGSAAYAAIETVTGELTGLSGKLNIIIEGGKHAYEFDYVIETRP